MKKILRLRYYFAVFCTFLTLSLSILPIISCKKPDLEPPKPAEPEIIIPDLSVYFNGGQDLILISYRDPELTDKVLSFFEDLTGSNKIAGELLVNASAFDVAPALAFALCAEESAFNPQALNRNRNGTIDRGLFQLNSASFPHLKVVEFYDIELNTRLGLAHLRWCLDTAGTEVSALAMYNAGTNRVIAHGTPKHTLDYVARILTRQRKIENLFLAEYPGFLISGIAEIPEDSKKSGFSLNLLTPLGGR